MIITITTHSISLFKGFVAVLLLSLWGGAPEEVAVCPYNILEQYKYLECLKIEPGGHDYNITLEDIKKYASNENNLANNKTTIAPEYPRHVLVLSAGDLVSVLFHLFYFYYYFKS
jgi:hypothetical protein